MTIPARPIPFNSAKLILSGGAIVIGWIFLSNCFTTINAGERGVLMHFGKVQNTILDEGIHFRFPIGTSVKTLNVRVQKTDIEVPVGTKDLQVIMTNLSLNWHLDPTQVNKIYQRLGDEQQIIASVIKPTITEVLKAATPRKTAEEILKQRAELKLEIDEAVKTRLAGYGIQVDDVSLVNVAFSPEFTKSIEAKQIAEQEAKQAEYLAIKAKRQAEAAVNLARGQAESQRLLKETLTPELLQKQAIDKWNGQFPTVIAGDQALPLLNLQMPR
jgi:prohibitin 1